MANHHFSCATLASQNVRRETRSAGGDVGTSRSSGESVRYPGEETDTDSAREGRLSQRRARHTHAHTPSLDQRRGTTDGADTPNASPQRWRREGGRAKLPHAATPSTKGQSFNPLLTAISTMLDATHPPPPPLTLPFPAGAGEFMSSYETNHRKRKKEKKKYKCV